MQNKNEDQIQNNSQTREEMEKELNIQRNKKVKNKYPNISDMEMNQLNYYNEIAKQNIPTTMKNPTLKDLVRITKDESCLEQLKAKLQSQESKDLQKMLQNLPLIRVERINYKNLEIGQMRQKLHSNHFGEIDKEKGKQFATNVFAKRLKRGGKYVPMKPIDDLMRNQALPNKESKGKRKPLISNINDCRFWIKKYKKPNYIKTNNEEEKTNKKVINDVRIGRNNDESDLDKVSNTESNFQNKIMTNSEKNINNINNLVNMSRNPNSSMNESKSFIGRNQMNFLNQSNTVQNEISDKTKNHKIIYSDNDLKAQNDTPIPQDEEKIRIIVKKRLGNPNNINNSNS